VGFGGMSLTDAALVSRHSKGMAVVPMFGRPRPPDQKYDVFVLMPFDTKLSAFYADHIRTLAQKIGISIGRADDIFAPRPFMEKVWDGICAANMVLADCTDKKPNVFYEIGIAHAI